MQSLPVAEFRRLVERELLRRNLAKVKLPGETFPAFCRPSLEVRRFFAPHAMKRPWGNVLLGVLGVEVPAYARWLASKGQSPRLARLTYYISNERQFIDPPSVVTNADLPALDSWIDRIVSRCDGLPADFREIARLRSQPFGEGARHLADNPQFWTTYDEWRATARKGGELGRLPICERRSARDR
ncbi:hypothetical protein [Phenylobacterium sp.]|uniref:hypothetical protein n=1 Tax=Phenylobacterium sp. TaxID=1871053 RepID=UPI002EDB7A48